MVELISFINTSLVKKLNKNRTVFSFILSVCNSFVYNKYKLLIRDLNSKQSQRSTKYITIPNRINST